MNTAPLSQTLLAAWRQRDRSSPWGRRLIGALIALSFAISLALGSGPVRWRQRPGWRGWGQAWQTWFGALGWAALAGPGARSLGQGRPAQAGRWFQAGLASAWLTDVGDVADLVA